MNNPIDMLLRPHGNIEDVTMQILHTAGVRFTRTSLISSLQKHPRYPSMAAVSDVLFSYGIDTLGLKVDDCQELSTSENYFMVQVKDAHQSSFALVFGQSPQLIYWYNPMLHRRESIERQEFCKIFTGYIMLIDTDGKKDELHYSRHHRIEIARQLIENAILFFPVLLAVVLMVKNATMSMAVLSLLLLMGCTISLFLMLYEYNQQSPLVSHMCVINKQVNCGSVLRSSASHLLGVPLTVIGASYFLGTLVALCLTNANSQMLFLVAVLHLLAICYAIYSLYYQAKVVRKWCPLCLSVQAVSIAIFAILVSIQAYNKTFPSSFSPYIILLSSHILSFACIYILWLLYVEHYTHKRTESELSSMKFNKDVFYAYLHNSRKLEADIEGFGITLGNPHGSIRIVKVCHPYCSHCADAQPVLQRIANNNKDVRLQVVFAADPNEKSYQQTPIDHFLCLAHEGADMEEVLSDWYSSPQKDPNAFLQKYPVSKQYTPESMAEAERMLDFCKKAKIEGTPTIFVNGFELPSNYLVEDLMYCLS